MSGKRGILIAQPSFMVVKSMFLMNCDELCDGDQIMSKPQNRPKNVSTSRFFSGSKELNEALPIIDVLFPVVGPLIEGVVYPCR